MTAKSFINKNNTDNSAIYNEVHIGDLIVDKAYRRDGVGSKLVEAVENAYKDKGYEKIALTTFGFQAPEFYKNTWI